MLEITRDKKVPDKRFQRQSAIDHSDQTLRSFVSKAVQNYFMHLDGQEVTNVYSMVLSEIEAPLLEIVMKHAQGNQSRAAHLLGLNRGTLRKKLKQYRLL